MGRGYKHGTPDGVQVLLRCRAINMSLLWSEEQEETIRFHLRSPPEVNRRPAPRDFLMKNLDRFQLASLALIFQENEASV